MKWIDWFEWNIWAMCDGWCEWWVRHPACVARGEESVSSPRRGYHHAGPEHRPAGGIHKLEVEFIRWEKSDFNKYFSFLRKHDLYHGSESSTLVTRHNGPLWPGVTSDSPPLSVGWSQSGPELLHANYPGQARPSLSRLVAHWHHALHLLTALLTSQHNTPDSRAFELLVIRVRFLMDSLE